MKLHINKKQTGGRNNQGVITTFHRGGGNKKLYRIIDFKRSLFQVPGIVKKIEQDPNRNCLIALINYKNGLLSYILAPKNLKQGDKINQYAGHTYISPWGNSKDENFEPNRFEIQIGNAMPLKLAPIGSFLHNLELKPGKGGQMMRSAGTFAKLLSKHFPKTNQKSTENKVGCIIRFNSGKLFSLSNEAMATLGTVSDKQSQIENNKSNTILSSNQQKPVERVRVQLRKAGQNRWRGRRPTVRGVAMNPIDHPHGGGEGKSKGGGHPVTPWGKLTKGKPTVQKKK